MAEEMRRGYSIAVMGTDAPAFKKFPTELATSSQGEIAKAAEEELLFIDDEPVPFLKTDDGYFIFFEPAAGTLMEAARSFVDTQPEKTSATP